MSTDRPRVDDAGNPHRGEYESTTEFLKRTGRIVDRHNGEREPERDPSDDNTKTRPR